MLPCCKHLAGACKKSEAECEFKHRGLTKAEREEGKYQKLIDGFKAKRIADGDKSPAPPPTGGAPDATDTKVKKVFPSKKDWNTNLCGIFARRGKCFRGDKCAYKHGDTLARSIQPLPPAKGAGKGKK